MFANRELIKNSTIVAKTHKVISSLDLMLSKVKDGETGFRGYLVTADEKYLDTYYGSQKSADSIYREIKLLVADNKTQHQDLNQIKNNIEIAYSSLENTLKTIRYSNQANTKGMLDSFARSKIVMDEIRSDVTDMQQREEILLIQRDKKLKTTIRVVQSLVISSIIIAFILALFSFSAHVKGNKERMKAAERLIANQDELKERIAELATANTQLVQMRREEKFAATGRIARTIAHEIRNPLTNINLAAEQLSSEMPSTDENTGFLFEMITRNSNRINQLLSGLLNSTKFSELNYQKVSINEMVDEVLQLAADRMQLNNVSILKNYGKGIGDITVDKEKIKIAFLNIIINAIESMEGKQDAAFIIETRQEGDKCIIMISDSGCGIDEESLSKIFDPYFTSKPKGNGLGMTNTQNIILNHKGNIQVKSKKGIGSSFTITLNI
jgi:signal transduction histidine kinase